MAVTLRTIHDGDPLPPWFHNVPEDGKYLVLWLLPGLNERECGGWIDAQRISDMLFRWHAGLSARELRSDLVRAMTELGIPFQIAGS